MTSRPVFLRTAALSLSAVTALALTACNPVSTIGPSPTPQGSHLATPYDGAPAKAGNKTGASSLSAPATKTTVLGTTWADGSPIVAEIVRPLKATASVKASRLPQSTKTQENWKAVLADGTPIGLSGGGPSEEKPPPPYDGLIALKNGKTVNALDPATDMFKGSRASYVSENQAGGPKGGPFPTDIAAVGAGFVFLSAPSANWDESRYELYRVDKVGGKPVLLKRFEASSKDRYEVPGDLAIGEDADDSLRVYWSYGDSSGSVIQSMPITGGAVRLDAKGAAFPMPTARGLYATSVGAKDYAVTPNDVVTGAGPVVNGKVKPLIIETHPNSTAMEASVSSDGRYLAWVPDSSGAQEYGEKSDDPVVAFSVDVTSNNVVAFTESSLGGLNKDGQTRGTSFVTGGFCGLGLDGAVSLRRPGTTSDLAITGVPAAASFEVVASTLSDGSVRLLAQSSAWTPEVSGWVATLP